MSIIIDKELEQLKEYDNSFQWFIDNYDDLYSKYANEFVAIKKQIYHDKDFNKLLQTLRENHIEPAQTFIDFIRK